MGRNIRRIASWRDRHVGRKAGTYIDRQADRQVHISTRRQTGKAKKQGREARQGGKTEGQGKETRPRGNVASLPTIQNTQTYSHTEIRQKER